MLVVLVLCNPLVRGGVPPLGVKSSFPIYSLLDSPLGFDIGA